MHTLAVSERDFKYNHRAGDLEYFINILVFALSWLFMQNIFNGKCCSSLVVRWFLLLVCLRAKDRTEIDQRSWETGVCGQDRYLTLYFAASHKMGGGGEWDDHPWGVPLWWCGGQPSLADVKWVLRGHPLPKQFSRGPHVAVYPSVRHRTPMTIYVMKELPCALMGS